MFYSLKNRLIAFFVLLLVLSFSAVSFLIFNESRSMIRNYIESSALEKMDEYGSFVNMALMQIYDLSSIVFNSDATKTWDNTLIDPNVSDGEKMLANIDMSQFLTRATNSYSSISSVLIYRQEGLWVGTDNQVMEDSSFLQESWYQQFKQKGDRWVNAHTDEFEAKRSSPYKVVSLLLPIGTFEPSIARNVMKVNVNEQFFLEPLNRIHLGDSGTIFLLDEEGQPILSQDDYKTHTQEVQKVEEIRNSQSMQGVVYVDNERGYTDILVYKKLKESNWMLVCFVPENELFAKLNKLRTSIFFVASLLLIAAIIIATSLSYGITKPLSRLASAMRYVQQGDFSLAESRIPPERSVRNEVGFVTSTFRHMVGQLRHHIKMEFELKLLRQRAEYKALLMQINPHFLFNTLELLSSLAIQQRTQDTVRVIESLGKMLRFSLRSNDDIVPLSEEMQYVKHYASILQIRFREKLTVSIEMNAGPELERLHIVKFILQPLLENAVKYSFQQQTEAEVRVTVGTHEGKLSLCVSDNGPGMQPDLVQSLYAEARAMHVDQILNSRTRQIGLRNVLARCQLYYGELFTFVIDSNPGEGTRIELCLPIQEGKQDVSSHDRG
ncbi:sensor histidine kinase [Paenibacillus hexagrammi]|uniref:histidine kinase n=1 Tax=Paenibacillus hexagrammi TaxID=2908839 RepID=A0ABY3SI22_9BACL|nr:sensor histidine kinase [Paenibacillus sp. YPD9-1]UJF33423.1 sensor histidine kinase [Paenibacillus sp. YPD9-1]